ncbi:MAG: hypothetical protein ABI353_16265 [Isosphaeraceae bacterium]
MKHSSRVSTVMIAFGVVGLFVSGASDQARAGGRRGGYVVTSGPAAVIAVPATAYYTGSGLVPAAYAAPMVMAAPVQAVYAAPVQTVFAAPVQTTYAAPMVMAAPTTYLTPTAYAAPTVTTIRREVVRRGRPARVVVPRRVYRYYP